MRLAKRTPMHQVEQQYSYEQVAELLSIGESTVREYVRNGKITPIFKISHKNVRIPASAVNRFLESRAVG